MKSRGNERHGAGRRFGRCAGGVILLALMSSIAPAGAQDAGRGQSIMYGDDPGTHSELTTLTAGTQQDRGDRCIELLREADALKGKPQRRSTAMERYRAECELR